MLIFILLAEVDKRTVGYRRRKLSIEKGTHAMLALLGTKSYNSGAKYVFLTAGFTPCHLRAVKRMGLDDRMLEKSPISFFIKVLKRLLYQ